MAEAEIQQQVVRTVLAFCRLAERADSDAREDLVDSSAALLNLWLAGSEEARAAALERWCQEATAVLARLQPADNAHALLRAQARVLRLRAALPAKAPAPRPVAVAVAKPAPKQTPLKDLSASAKAVLNGLKGNPGLRTRDLIARFAGKLSDRTVMRSLKELTEAGAVKKTQDGGAAAYEVIEESV
jgi:hypothetical protein